MAQFYRRLSGPQSKFKCDGEKKNAALTEMKSCRSIVTILGELRQENTYIALCTKSCFQMMNIFEALFPHRLNMRGS
jgi:hypothetical protein